MKTYERVCVCERKFVCVCILFLNIVFYFIKSIHHIYYEISVFCLSFIVKIYILVCKTINI